MAIVGGMMLAALLAAGPETAAFHPVAADSLTVRFFAKIYLLPSEDAPLLGLGEDGLRLPVYRRKEGWAQVGFLRTTGWIRTTSPSAAAPAAVAPAPAEAGTAAAPSAVPRGWGLLLALCLAGSALLALCAAYLASRRGRRVPRSGPPVPAVRRAMLLAPRQKVIESHLTGAFIPLDQALRDLGFAVEYVDSLARCAARFRRGEVPAVFGVDARLGRKPSAAALDLCRRAGRAPVMIFLYNSDDPQAIRPPADLPQVHYLNGRFSSRHVMELLAPLYHAHPSAQGEEAIAAAPCSLAGRIGPGGLADILQFLEVGRRSGMLSIEDGPPAGVLNFAQGIITFAQTRAAEGADAVLEILSMTRGGFRFYGDKRIDQDNCRLSAFEATLYWAHLRDETQKMAHVRAQAWAQGAAAT